MIKHTSVISKQVLLINPPINRTIITVIACNSLKTARYGLMYIYICLRIRNANLFVTNSFDFMLQNLNLLGHWLSVTSSTFTKRSLSVNIFSTSFFQNSAAIVPLQLTLISPCSKCSSFNNIMSPMMDEKRPFFLSSKCCGIIESGSTYNVIYTSGFVD